MSANIRHQLEFLIYFQRLFRCERRHQHPIDHPSGITLKLLYVLFGKKYLADPAALSNGLNFTFICRRYLSNCKSARKATIGFY
jgi:hypothetical protein